MIETNFNSKLITKTILCGNSGIALGAMQIFLHEGHMPYMQAHNDAVFLHPFYNMSPAVLIKKLESSIKAIRESGEEFPALHMQERLQLLTSALTFSLGTVQQQIPTLPSFAIAYGSASRTLALCNWYHFNSSKRMRLPTYHVSTLNGNLAWENYKHWLDTCFEIKEDWQQSVRTMQNNALLRELGDEVSELSIDLRKIDVSKVWNWIAIQLASNGKIDPGRIQNYKNLFLKGDLDPEYWIKDDIEDLEFDIIQFCDENNDIMFAIRRRLNAIKAIIEDFYGSFTVVFNPGNKNISGTSDKQTPEEEKFFGEIEAQATALGSLPEEPKEKDFKTRGLFMQAQAKWKLLKKAFDARAEKNSPDAPESI